MVAAIKVFGATGCRIEDVGFVGFDVGIDLVDSPSAHFDNVNVSGNAESVDHLKLYGSKVGRNHLCPCGSGVKTKNCKGAINVSTGIRSDNSTFTVGKANIVADIGIDLKNKSHAQIEELNHYAPDTPAALIHALKRLPVQPPSELVKDAIEHQKSTGSIDGSKLWDWFSKQGINLSFWAQLSVAFAGLG